MIKKIYRKIRCSIICYWLNLFLALDTLACQVFFNRYPHTLSSRESAEGDNNILSIDGEKMAILDVYLNWLGVKMPVGGYEYVLNISNHYKKWDELIKIGRAFFRTDGVDIYYGEYQ